MELHAEMAMVERSDQIAASRVVHDERTVVADEIGAAN
jgi:hypothetical protein